MATSQENIEFLNLFNEALQTFDLTTACQIRNLTLTKINELEQGIVEQRLAFRKETLEKAAELGLTVPPKYWNPNETDKTWTGQGKPPKWVKAALESGKTLDDLLIPTTNIDPEVGF